MRCKEVMSESAECIAMSERVCDAAARMKEIDSGFLPVFDPNKKRVVGTLTDRDIAIRVVAQNKPVDTPVRDVMTRDPVTCRIDDDIQHAHELMAEHQISRMIVMDDGRIAGIISLADLSAATPDQTSDTLGEVKRP